MTVKASHHPATFGNYRYCGSGDIMVLVSHVISQEHMNKVWSNVMSKSPLWQDTSLPKLVAIDTMVVET